MNASLIDDIKARWDCRQVVETDLGPPMHRSGNSYTWPCPFHSERTPGAFHVFTDGFKCFSSSCGKAGDVFTWAMEYHGLSFQEAAERLNGGQPVKAINPQESARLATERAERVARDLERKISEAQRALEELRQAQSWMKYYDSLDEHARQLWRGRGIPDHYQDFWQLGYCADYALWKMEDGQWLDWWHTPTLSIPVWGQGWQLNNVKHRLLKEPASGDKYRQEKHGVPPAPFMACPDRDSGPLLLLEGEIKAMVTFSTIEADTIQVAGLPSATPNSEIYQAFKDYEPVYICMDPDAYDPPKAGEPPAVQRAADAIGHERARLLWLPGKIDDVINAGFIGKQGLRRLIRSARKIKT